MDLFEAIDKRRTLRDFENFKIPESDIKKIIDAGCKAPTNDHMRDWHFIVITDKEKLQKLLELIPKKITNNDLEELFKKWNLDNSLQQDCYRNAVPKQYRMLHDASCVIVPLFKQKVDLMHPDNLSHLNGFASIWCCIENMYLAATALNYGLTLRIPLGEESEWSRKVLGYPSDYLMPCFIAIGKPVKNAPSIKQKPLNIEEKLHYNEW